MGSELDRRSRTRLVITVIVQALVAVTTVVIIYYVAPTTGSSIGPVACAVVFLAVSAFELRAVVRDPYPVRRAALAMARVLPLFIVLFAWIYVAMSASDPHTFSEPLTKSGSLYFTITVLSTVGFGDITPVADYARLMVAAQMICDLVVIGILVKLITGVAKRAHSQRSGAAPETGADSTHSD
jgi:voltage-gated potassium channel